MSQTVLEGVQSYTVFHVYGANPIGELNLFILGAEWTSTTSRVLPFSAASTRFFTLHVNLSSYGALRQLSFGSVVVLVRSPQAPIVQHGCHATNPTQHLPHFAFLRLQATVESCMRHLRSEHALTFRVNCLSTVSWRSCVKHTLTWLTILMV